ncbi:MAG: hypothetical protein J6Y69_11645 [Treponema sp.]|nr:hypothetical protein [Treponema sp.]
MGKTILQQARLLMRQRRFDFATRLLESYSQEYKGSFEFYLALGTSYLYLGSYGEASKYYDLARGIKINNTELLIGQGAIYLSRGDITHALQYYLNAMEIDPNNEVALDALEFIKKNAKNFIEIQKLKSKGTIKDFYPPIGINPLIIRNCVMVGLLIGIIVSLFIIFWPREKVKYDGPRADLSALKLTTGEKKNAVSEDLSTAAVHYILDNETINKSYENIVMYYSEHRDNPARVEINRLINSNASPSIKQKALQLKAHLSDDITFDKLEEKDNYSYEKVESDHILYEGCFVAWTGAIADPGNGDDGSWYCTLLVGYETSKHLEGAVNVIFRPENVSPVNTDRPIRILGVVSEVGGKIYLDGRSVYQPVSGKFE